MNFNNNRAVPFEITNISHGLRELKGLIKVNKESFELEFEVQDSFLGYFKSGITHLTIPFSDLESIDFKKGWLSAEIILEAKSMKAFKDLPGAEVATCILKIKRKDREEAKRLISKARMLFSEYNLKNLDGEE